MGQPLYFSNSNAFEMWLKENYNTSSGIDIYIYKKGYEKEGITYEEAVQTALCYGWIDAVTHKCDEIRFIQYFARRLKTSKWSLSNKIRVRDLIASGRMTEHGMTYFDMVWLETLDEAIEAEKKAKQSPVEVPEFARNIFIENGALEAFLKETRSTKRRYIRYIVDAKKEETKIRRCKKVAQIVKGDIKNNL